jgi:hypothetical protein
MNGIPRKRVYTDSKPPPGVEGPTVISVATVTIIKCASERTIAAAACTSRDAGARLWVNPNRATTAPMTGTSGSHPIHQAVTMNISSRHTHLLAVPKVAKRSTAPPSSRKAAAPHTAAASTRHGRSLLSSRMSLNIVH